MNISKVIKDKIAEAKITGTDAEVTEKLNALQSYDRLYIDERDLYSILGAADADALLVGLDVYAPDHRAARLLKWFEPAQGGVDVSCPVMQRMLGELAAAGAIAPDSVSKLIAQCQASSTWAVATIGRQLRIEDVQLALGQ